MSTFYGQVEGMSQTVASRRGSRDSGIKASVQSWDGSLISRMWYDNDGNLKVALEVSNDSSSYGDTIFRGSLDDLRSLLERR